MQQGTPRYTKIHLGVAKCKKVHPGTPRYIQVHSGADCSRVLYARCRVWMWWAPLPRSGASAGYLAKQQRARRHGQARVCRKYRANVRQRGRPAGGNGQGSLQQHRLPAGAQPPTCSHPDTTCAKHSCSREETRHLLFKAWKALGRHWTSLLGGEIEVKVWVRVGGRGYAAGQGGFR